MRGAVGQPDRHRRRRLAGHDRGRAARAAHAVAPGRSARDGAGRDRHPAQRRREGEPVLPARLQPRPRHRLRDLDRRRAGEPAEPRSRPGLHRPQLPDPRAVERVDFRKGPYDARDGDFSSAGRRGHPLLRRDAAGASRSSRPGMLRLLPRRARRFARASAAGNLLYGVELYYNDGPWDHPDHYQQVQRRAALQRRRRASGATASPARRTCGDWDATDQVARRAVRRCPASIASTRSTRARAATRRSTCSTASGTAPTTTSATRGARLRLLPGPRPVLELHLLPDEPDQGDQFEQRDRRWVGGATASHTWFGDAVRPRDRDHARPASSAATTSTTACTRRVRRHRATKLDYDGVDEIPADTRRDDIWEISVSPYLENRLHWTDWMRTVVGRARRLFHFDVDSDLAGNSGRRDDAHREPEGNAGPRPVGRRPSSTSPADSACTATTRAA